VTYVGILGGTFNPPHIGHLALARGAIEELGLERVLLMPARVPPHKPPGEDPGPEHRLQMCRQLAEGIPGVSACAFELGRDGPSYTVNTLRAIHASHPDARLTFLVGADTAATLPTWREPEALMGLAELAVAARGSAGRKAVVDALAPLLEARQPPQPGRSANGRVKFLGMPAVEASSSTARERVARGEPIDGLVGPGVARYIDEHGLYRPRREAAS
jgi:nicotinate-nucleotide adenylyltransferase